MKFSHLQVAEIISRLTCNRVRHEIKGQDGSFSSGRGPQLFLQFLYTSKDKKVLSKYRLKMLFLFRKWVHLTFGVAFVSFLYVNFYYFWLGWNYWRGTTGTKRICCQVCIMFMWNEEVIQWTTECFHESDFILSSCRCEKEKPDI